MSNTAAPSQERKSIVEGADDEKHNTARSAQQQDDVSRESLSTAVSHPTPQKNTTIVSQCSTPSSPSELLRLVKRKSSESSIEEARQFSKELGDWINKDHSPFEDTLPDDKP